MFLYNIPMEFFSNFLEPIIFQLGWSCFRFKGVTLANNYGAGSGPIWIDDLRCTLNDTSLHTCDKRSWGSNNCGHGEDISIRCREEVEPTVSSLNSNNSDPSQHADPDVSKYHYVHKVEGRAVFIELN